MNKSNKTNNNNINTNNKGENKMRNIQEELNTISIIMTGKPRTEGCEKPKKEKKEKVVVYGCARPVHGCELPQNIKDMRKVKGARKESRKKKVRREIKHLRQYISGLRKGRGETDVTKGNFATKTYLVVKYGTKVKRGKTVKTIRVVGKEQGLVNNIKVVNPNNVKVKYAVFTKNGIRNNTVRKFSDKKIEGKIDEQGRITAFVEKDNVYYNRVIYTPTIQQEELVQMIKDQQLEDLGFKVKKDKNWKK